MVRTGTKVISGQSDCRFPPVEGRGFLKQIQMKSSEQFIYEQEMEYEQEKRIDKKLSPSILLYKIGKSFNNNNKSTKNANSSNKQLSAEGVNTSR